jgi:metal-dependent HD superfamily phosphatase/phosphodiesterase
LSIAGQICRDQHGFKPDNWYARIFEYSTAESETTGHIKEYFYNPHSATHREITKNIEYFSQLIEKGLSPDEKKNKKKIIKALTEEI